MFLFSMLSIFSFFATALTTHPIFLLIFSGSGL
jgi:hypothetical protein